MIPTRPLRGLAVVMLLALPAPARADGLPRFTPTAEQLRAGYERAKGGRPGRVVGERLTPHWAEGDAGFWYRNDLVNGARAFVAVDVGGDAGARRPAFDHKRLAAGLSAAAGREYAADRLPFDAIALAADQSAVRFTVAGKRWRCDLTTYAVEADAGPVEPAAPPAAPPRRGRPGRESAPRSPDGTRTALLRGGDVVVRDKADKEQKLTADGRGYDVLSWSPDGKFLVAFRVTPGENKPVHLLESSPKDGGRAVLHSRPYPLPGDRLAAYEPRLFAADTGKEVAVDAPPVDLGYPRVHWAADGSFFAYEKHDRGHQRFRLIAVDVATGRSRNLVDERSATFIWSAHLDASGLDAVTWLPKSGEFVRVSESTGWRHLSLHDAATGKLKNPITKGDWVVRGVDRVDEERRAVWFRAGGVNPGEDPYHVHHYRVNFDGTNLVPLTAGDGTHTVQYSPGRKYLVDTFSRVDTPPVHELRRVSDGKLLCKLETADASELRANGWAPPEVLTAKGRDGTTDIWGVICRPRGFDPARKYPVVEQIYAGPQGAFVPKSFAGFDRFAHLTELGFVVVQVDGMGTANRSKAFHDVCWKNLKDAGFPDRILWHRAAAAKYPWYDASRVGITGGSAGGQNAAGAVLFHGDFYKAAVAACGCHDNRMDKASWNEQWMGLPVGPHYAACSNIDNAHKLTGKLLLIVGEMDNNVPPESTHRLAGALIKANKDFDFLSIPGGGHGDGGAYGMRRRQDFFVRHLHGVDPPDRNAAGPAAPGSSEPRP